jgi:hypothetical protein
MSPQIAFSKPFATLAGIWLAGFLMRRAAVHSENELVSQIAAMTLFAPMSVAVAWIGWRTRIRWREIALLVLVILAAFIGWNGVMLFGVPSDVLFRAIQTNAAHWVFYLLAGALSTRFFQWFCGIGIWSRERGEGVQLDEPNAKPLSIMKLMMMVALIAFLMAAYRHWVIKAASSDANFYTPFQINLYQIFPMHTKPIVSAIVGGLLLGVHWTVISVLVERKTLRLAGLVAWLAIMIAIRWGSNQIYFMSNAELFENALSNPILLADLVRRLDASTSSIQYAVEAFVQLALTLLAFAWLAWLGFRVGIQAPTKSPVGNGFDDIFKR